MRSALIIMGGLVLLGVFVLLARWLTASAPTAVATGVGFFVPVWLALALFNLWLGVARAGYSLADELPVFLMIFAIPAAAGAALWWKLHG